MSERWGDSRRDREQLDRWITREDDRIEPDDEYEEAELSAPLPVHDVRVLGPVLDTWREMYADWENGRLPSPSVSDLIHVAENAWQCGFPDDAADLLYEAQCDGVELPELLIHLYDMRQES